MTLDRASNMQPAFDLKVSLMGFFRSWVRAGQFHRHLVNLDVHLPSVLGLMHTKEARDVIASRASQVLDVVGVRNVTKVRNPVVGSVSVDVVNFVLRPASVNVQPCETVPLDHLAVNLDVPVSAAVEATSNITSLNAVGCSDLAREDAGVGVVGQQRFEPVSRQFGGIAALHHVRNAEVVWVAIDKNELCLRPLAVIVQPSQLAKSIGVTVNNGHLTLWRDLYANVPRVWPLFAINQAGESSGVWVVIEKFAQACCAKIGLSHDAPCQRIGQKPRRVTSTPGLRHFNIGAA